MKEFVQHIENLLIKNDFVIIPDFGGFTFQQQSARITNTGITPPQTTVGFNSLLKNNDGLLAVAILRSENISSKEANLKIEQHVAFIKKQLRKKQKFQFGRLGVFYSRSEGQFIFFPSSDFDFLPNNFGLNEIRIKQREEETLLKIKFQTKNLVRYAAVSFVLLGLFASTQELGRTEAENYAGVQNPISLLFNSGTVAEAEFSLNENQVDFKTIEKEYHIIISNEQNEIAAQNYCSLLKSKNYVNAQILSSNTGHRIALESFSSPKIAKLYLNNYCRNNEEFKDAWILYEPAEEKEIN